MDVLSNFGVQPLLLAAQGVNFLILLFLLQKFLYKPILKMLQERKEKIAESMKNAEQIELNLQKTEEDREKRLNKAAEEAKMILDEATKAANQIIEEAHQKAAEDIKDLVAKSQEAMELERERMHQEIRGELANLVMSGLQKVSGKVLTKKDQEEVVNNSLKELQ